VDPELEQDAERARPVQALPVAAPTPVHDEPGGPERVASEMGNRNFGRLVARMRDGEGILADGLVHPDVQAAIAAAHGSGRPLDSGLAGGLGQAFGEPIDDVRVHTGDHAAALARAVSARAFAVGNDIFFGAGEYNPSTPDGTQLIAHEAAHVIQQRGAPPDGPLMVSHPDDAMEREAEALSRDVAG
jgi:hypothetical protein